MANAQSARRELLGLTLRRYREAAGLTGRGAAAIIDCDASKISRIESGTAGPPSYPEPKIQVQKPATTSASGSHQPP